MNKLIFAPTTILLSFVLTSFSPIAEAERMEGATGTCDKACQTAAKKPQFDWGGGLGSGGGGLGGGGGDEQ